MIAAGLTLLAFFALAAAMPRHAPALLGAWTPRIPAPALRTTGWSLLLAAFAAALWARDWPLALVSWIGMLTASAACMLLGLTYDARIARAAALLGAIGIIAGIRG